MAAWWFMPLVAEEAVGRIGSVNTASGELLVNVPTTGRVLRMGERLYVRIEGVVVLMKATFPMSTTSRCRLEPRYARSLSKLKPGMTVYRYYPVVEDEKKDDAKKHDPGSAQPRYAELEKEGRAREVGGIKFVKIPAGTFMMGSPDGQGEKDEHPQHKVTLDGFWVGMFEVTQKQYRDIMGSNPSEFKGNDIRPVETVSWYDAVEFCKKFSSKYGVEVRLPTEAEWEYACRAGSTTRYYWGDSDEYEVVDQYAVYDKNSYDNGENHKDYGPHVAGSKKPNSWGLYDMSGNVWEWCADWYVKDYYGKSPSRNPQGPSSGGLRVVRGGSWDRDDGFVRSAGRNWYRPDLRTYGDCGFRVVFSAP